MNSIKHPGSGYYYTICAICGRKIRAKDAVRIRDRYNLLFNQVVCRQDYELTNPQNIPYKPRAEKALKSDLVRPPGADVFVTNENSYQAPGAPTGLIASVDPLDGYVQLTWLGPDSSGSDPITGYKIVREEPQGGISVVLTSNTGNNTTYYLDTTSDIAASYTYQVAAINNYGVGAYSGPAYFPIYDTAVNIYLASYDPNVILKTGDGEYLGITGE